MQSSHGTLGGAPGARRPGSRFEHDAKRIVAHVSKAHADGRILPAGMVELAVDVFELVFVSQDIGNGPSEWTEEFQIGFVERQLKRGSLKMLGEHVGVVGIDNGMFGCT